MGNAGKFSRDAVLRARVLLLASEWPALRERVGAYRVLAEVSPRAYLPKLTQALGEWARELGDPEQRLSLYAESVDVSRRLGAEVPDGEELLRHTLGRYEHALFAAGRRAEGRAVCEELAETEPYGRLAVVLAEEGRHAEAADLYGRHLRSGGTAGTEWALIEWAAELDAAGRHEEALRAFERLVEDARRGAAADRAPLASLAWKLNEFARMLRAAGRPAEEAEARRETLALLARLAREGEPVSWNDIRGTWSTLFALSGRGAEPAATPETPQPPFGSRLRHGWSPDTLEAFFASAAALEEETVTLGESGDLAGLIVAHRRLALRRALRWETAGLRSTESLRQVLDEGVALARRLPGDRTAAARALTDRAMFLVAAERYEEAHADFAEADALQGDTPIVTRA
ncbi:tetratricopeptide repeat protein [Streptomyces sp. SR27]|uniref:tetratricopeptide repeat protein n=1 Tax=Streptomyces sp. SR27 TaxID=3076630 RepID=UPI00295C3621|nr:tetratricopeptide repeat protein [Streptomyces sp. SR27]MDV9188760.1 tetratricopeptide repeat protein [Streptomyces sp. SR27]